MKSNNIKKILSNRRVVRIVAIILIVSVLSISTFAWYYNNREVLFSSDGSITVKSNGSIQLTFTESTSWTNARTITMTSKNYDDITGDGINMYFPTITQDGTLDTTIMDYWPEAEKDDGRGNIGTNSLGQYIALDLTIRADVPMNIYLLDTTKIYPSSTVATGSYKSSYGNFSKNWIAAATRIAFTQYTVDENNNKVFPRLPNLIFVPLSSVELVKYSTTYGLNTSGSKESEYYYYSVNEYNTAMNYYTVGRLNNDKIAGQIVNNVNNRIVSPIYITGNTMMPGVYSGDDIKPAVWINNSAEDGGGHYCIAALTYGEYFACEYYGSNYAFIGKDGNRYITTSILEDNLSVVGYIQAEKYVNPDNADDYYWKAKTNTTAITHSEIYDNLYKEEGTYTKSNWVELDNDFNQTTSDEKYTYCDYPICTTNEVNSDGFYIARFLVNIWVEGTDREALIPLNSGSFTFTFNLIGQEI